MYDPVIELHIKNKEKEIQDFLIQKYIGIRPLSPNEILEIFRIGTNFGREMENYIRKDKENFEFDRNLGQMFQ